MNNEVRCRIAPSPTGEPHVGTAYIALMNLCFAKKNNGKFILRIEDTDKERSTKESEDNIFESLKWLNLNWDEGPDIGGEYGPYRQSERLDIYKEYIQILLDKGKAYRCFCTTEDLSELRKKQIETKSPKIGYFGDISKCRDLSDEEINEKLNNNVPFVIRLKVPNTEDLISFYDEIRKQEISKKSNEIDDQVLVKSDGYPTYHFASITDDHLMKITHVFRGEEWINSTFKHVLLYKSFDWEPPKFFHLGLLRNPDANKSKISKRKNPVSLRWFRAAGYTPYALLNFLGLMGYSRYNENMTKEEKKSWEIFSLNDLISDFDTNKISSTGPAFDFVKLDDLNFQYIASMNSDDFYNHMCQRIQYLKEYLNGFENLFKERYLRAEKEITYWTQFLFKQKLTYNKSDFDKIKLENYNEGSVILNKFKKLLSKKVEKLSDSEKIKNFILESIQELQIKSKTIHMLLRIAVTGSTESIPLYEAMHLLGLYRVIVRIQDASQFLKTCK